MSATKTLEQEFAELTEATNYVVRMSTMSSYLHVHVIYVPSFRMAGRDEHRYVAANGEIGHKLFGGRWRYRHAGRWVRKTIRQHQQMLRDMGPVTLA